MKVLVTGGAGFIGSNLALELERQGHEVVVADHHLATRDTSLKGFSGRLLQLDVSRPFTLEDDFDAIFHQAAITDPRHPDPEEVYERNVTGFELLLEWCLARGTRLIYASTAGLYGNGPTPMHEDQPKQIQTPYGASKLKMDEMAAQHFGDLHVVGLRYFNVFGPREAHKGRPASMVYHLTNQMREGRRPKISKHGEHRRDFIYVKDVVLSNLKAVTAPSGVYNVGTGIGTTFNELVRVLNEVMGTSLEPEYIDMPFDAATYQSNTVADIRYAEEKLRFKAEWSLTDGVRDYLEWMGVI